MHPDSTSRVSAEFTHSLLEYGCLPFVVIPGGAQCPRPLNIKRGEVVFPTGVFGLVGEGEKAFYGTEGYLFESGGVIVVASSTWQDSIRVQVVVS